MSNASVNLLRLLEPTVRPGGLSAGPVKPVAPVPFERQSFASLMADFSKAPGAEVDLASGGTPVAEESISAADRATLAPQPLAALGGLDRIENPTLRALLAATSAASSAASPAA
ncbi:MAG: hypothetical protein V3V20_07125 [Algisphaera sp.]